MPTVPAARDRTRRRRPDGVHDPRADRLRGALRLLHHPLDARRLAQPADRRCSCARSRASRPPGSRRSIVTGVHLGSYGRDLAPPASLLDLLRALDAIDADVTFRISSLEPMDCTPAIVDLVARSGRFMPHFHLPLQHASDRMLAAMRRPYTLDYYRRLVDSIVARLPHASIGSDMIVGFPGETDEDFAANLAYLPSSPLTHLHVFPYSDRPGTDASAMRDKVHGSVIRDRGARAARHRRGAGRALPRVTDRHDPSRPDARGRHAGGDG